MVIYIDVLIFVNTIINYIILSTSKRFLCINVTYTRIILASFIGALFSLIVFFNNINSILSIFIKILCSISMCFIAFMKRDIRLYLKSIFITLIFSMVFTSFAILYSQLLKPKNFAILNDVIYIHINPFILVFLSILFYSGFILFRRIYSQNISNTLVNLKFQLNDINFTCIGKIDTGCNVVEPFSGFPVIIAEKSVLRDIDTAKARIIPYRVLGDNNILYGVKATKVYIDNKEINKKIYIGIYDGTIDKNFKSIINSEIIR